MNKFQRILFFSFPAIAFLILFFLKKHNYFTENNSENIKKNEISLASKQPSTTSHQENLINKSQTATKQQLNSNEESSKIKKLLKKIAPEASWTFITDDTGRINSISGGNIANFSSSYESGFILAQDIAEALNIPKNQIGKTDFQLKETGLHRSYRYQQFYQDYIVDNGYIDFFINKSSNNIYDITSELRELGDVNTEIAVSLPAAVDIVKEHFLNKNVEIKKEPDKPVVYNEENGKSHLTWKIIIKTKNPNPKEHHVYVSTVNGSIVEDQSLLKY